MPGKRSESYQMSWSCSAPVLLPSLPIKVSDFVAAWMLLVFLLQGLLLLSNIWLLWPFFLPFLKYEGGFLSVPPALFTSHAGKGWLICLCRDFPKLISLNSVGFVMPEGCRGWEWFPFTSLKSLIAEPWLRALLAVEWVKYTSLNRKAAIWCIWQNSNYSCRALQKPVEVQLLTTRQID